MQCISFNIDLESTAKINLYTLILAPGPLSRLSDLKEEGNEREEKRKRKEEGRKKWGGKWREGEGGREAREEERKR